MTSKNALPGKNGKFSGPKIPLNTSKTPRRGLPAITARR